MDIGTVVLVCEAADKETLIVVGVDVLPQPSTPDGQEVTYTMLVAKTVDVDVPELVGTGTALGGFVGAPENCPGAGRGVAYTVPSGPRTSSALSSIFPSSSASRTSMIDDQRVH